MSFYIMKNRKTKNKLLRYFINSTVKCPSDIPCQLMIKPHWPEAYWVAGDISQAPVLGDHPTWQVTNILGAGNFLDIIRVKLVR